MREVPERETRHYQNEARRHRMGMVSDENRFIEGSNPTVNMSERAVRNVRMGLTDSGSNVGIAIPRYRDTNPFSENPADVFTRLAIPRYLRRHGQRHHQDFIRIGEAFIRSFYMNPQESMDYVD